MERENFLHTIRSVLLSEMFFFTSTIEIGEVVLWTVNFLELSDSQVSGLRILRAKLMNWLISFLRTIKHQLSLDVELVRVWDLSVGALPPLKHDLSKVSLRHLLDMWSTKLLHPIGRSIIAADLPLRALFRGFRWIGHLTVFSGLGIDFVMGRGHLALSPRQVHLIRWIHNGVSLIGCISCALELSF